MRSCSLILSFVLLTFMTLTAESVDYFGRTYGGPATELPATVIREGSKYYIAGTTDSFGSGGSDVWIVKVDSKGKILSQKAYGTNLQEFATEIRRTSGKGLIVLGSVSLPGNGFDIWLLKLDKDGDIEWQKSYGGSGNQLARSIGNTRDKGYIVTGSDEETDTIFALKLDSTGEIEWQKSFDHLSDLPNGYSIQQTKDRGYILSGTLDEVNSQTSKIVLLKLDEDGNIEWQKLYGPSIYAEASFVREISGGYILASNGPNGGSDIWVLKLDTQGEILWQKLYGRPGSSEYAVHLRPRGKNFILIGKDSVTSSFVFRLNPGGKIIWQRELSTGTFGLVSLDRSKDGGYVLSGSQNGDLRLYKTDKSAKIDSSCPYPETSNFVTTDTNVLPEDVSLVVDDSAYSGTTTSAVSVNTTALLTEDCHGN